MPTPIRMQLPTSIIKRSGALTEFDQDKITSAIEKAGAATGEFGPSEAMILSGQACKVIAHRFGDAAPTIEEVQDIVEQTLISANHFETARAYIVYRERRRQARRDRATFVDVTSSVNEYLSRADWRVNANANQGYSLGGLILNVSGKVIANYWLSHVYPAEVGDAHRNGSMHIHDLDMLSGYCAGWSLRTLLNEGFNGVANKVESAPPKHLNSAMSQMVNFLGTLQNEWAGAQAFSSADTYLAPFVRVDHLTYEQVKQEMQSFIFNMNVPSRWGTQTPFSNLTFDWTCPEDIARDVPLVGGEPVDFTYGDLQEEMNMINRAFMEVMTEGDAKGRVFTFPIPTYNITKDFPWDGENVDRLFEMTAKYGLPYFQNFVNSDLEPHMVRSMCCRLQLDLRELLKRGNGLFGSAEQTGSIGVVTMNMARLGYKHKGDEQKRYLGTLRNHFSTIGVNGMNEMIRNFYSDTEDITTPAGRSMAIRILDHVREMMVEFQEETGHMYNLEATPAEGTTYRFAREDRKRYEDIIQAGTPEEPYYTNSSQLPVGFTTDPFLALSEQEELQKKYTGGTVLHLYLGERVSSAEACRELVRRSLENFRLPYITVTPTFSICPKHGYIAGEHAYCPICDEELALAKRKRLGL